MKEVIVLDIDGVLADLPPAYLKLASSIVSRPMPRRSTGRQMNWDFDDVLSKNEQSWIWDVIIESSSFWELLPRLTAEMEKYDLARIAENYDIVYITNRSGKNVIEQTELWLELNGFPFGKVIETRNKVDACNSIEVHQKIKAILEDRPSNIRELWKAGLPVVVRDWHYNRHVDIPAARVSSVSEFCGLIELDTHIACMTGVTEAATE